MKQLIQLTGIAGFFLCLCIMYLTPIGIRGIREYDPAFQMPDMKIHYSASQIAQDFEQISAGGRDIYRKYLILDFIFTVCFCILMMTITDLRFTGITRNLLFVICILRGVFDVLENSLLLITLKNFSSVNKELINICSWFTTCKFIMLYIWMFAVIAQLVPFLIKMVQGRRL